jgi:predicted nucleic acid-binding Zn ribbon protein
VSDRSGVRGGWPVRIGEIIAPAVERIAGASVMTEAKLRKVWSEVVGEQVAVHASVRRLRGSVLEVGVTSDAWATEVTYLSAAVIERLNAALGAGVVTQIVVQRNRQKRHGET